MIIWDLLLVLGLALALIAVVGWVLVVDESICLDRSPWWGPPTDPDSSCSGFAWAEKHPGEYPWTLPR